MRNSTPELLNWPLHGINLIEASAGTGKTWTLCGLYLRLLIEQGRSVRDILVVTFTTAATAELKARLRARLVEMQVALRDTESLSGQTNLDPFVSAYAHMLRTGGVDGIDAGAAWKMLDDALHQFDEAAVLTIHSFCQRALAEMPFSAGMPFAFEALQNDAELIEEVATDFYRTEVAGASLAPIVAMHLVERLAPQRIVTLLKDRLCKPLNQLRFDIPSRCDVLDQFTTHFETCRRLWHEQREEIVELLRAKRAALNGNAYRVTTLEAAFLAIDALMEQSYPCPPDEATRYLRASHIKTHTKGKASAPEHAFFQLFDELHELGVKARTELQGIELRLIERLLREAPETLRNKKREQRVIAFDDMLYNLWEALHNANLNWLATTLRKRYPVALIDEFQDTDPLQFDIFSAIYRSGQTPGPLFLVGDPKQAIYAFRGADLFTYLGAAEHADHRYTLHNNQRSTPQLISTQNALFSRGSQPFALEGIAYHPVTAGNRDRALFHDEGNDAALTLWMLPDDLVNKSEANRLSIAATSTEIARLLTDAQERKVMIGERPLTAGDITVIVRSHHQGRSIKRALLQFGIASVERSQDSVFDSPEAEVLEIFLRALAEPSRLRILNTALASDLFGFNAADIDAIGADEHRLAEILTQFAAYLHHWERRGFAAMWRQVQTDTKMVQRLLPQVGGERRVTNYIHLGELLHAESAHHAGADALLRRYRSLRSDERNSEQSQLRLESDEQLVQIVTIHASKGLEFPITFCPFLWSDPGRRKDESMRCNYHDAARVPISQYAVDHGAARDHEAMEEFAEDVRLLYVALTRAVYRTYLVAGPSLTGRDGGKASCKTALNWLVASDNRNIEAWLADGATTPPQIIAAWRQYTEQNPGLVNLANLPLEAISGKPIPSPNARSLAARIAERKIEPSWSLASFTSLSLAQKSGDPQPFETSERDHDQYLGETDLEPDENEQAGLVSADSFMGFPRGAEAGTLLHTVFEHADFGQAQQWDTAIARGLDRHPLTLPDLDAARSAPRLHAMLHAALTEVSRADLDGTGLRLADVRKTQRLDELAFSLPARAVDPTRLARVLDEAGEIPILLGSQGIAGYLRGTMDCVFRHRGRYYLADWKSNYLGARPSDYRNDPLRLAIAQSGYRLQYALYSLALHRFLRQRLPDYDYERDFGAVFYVFVRGVRTGWHESDGKATGIFRTRLSHATLQALDQLFVGESTGRAEAVR